MAETPSTMLPLGTVLPSFTLPNAVDGKPVSAESLRGGKGLLVEFICNHCPYVIHVREQVVALNHELLDKGFHVVAINSNSQKTHPQDGPSHMAALARQEKWRFPFLFDEAQTVAKAFDAACTPEFYLFDAEGKLAYRGQFDDSRPSNKVPVTGKDLRAAAEALLKGQRPDERQRPSVGCNIKWNS
jgi:peroxiredoxin